MDFERVAKLVVIALSGIFGLVLFAFPDQAAAALGVAGTDEFAFRSGGAAFLGYAVAFAAGWGVGPRALGILWPATLGAGLGTAVAAAITLVTGRSPGVVAPLILVGALVVAGTASFVMARGGAALPERTGRRFSPWFVAFLGWGVIASALFGLGGLILGSTFGSIVGFPGGDDPVYRLAGGATVGILVGSVLALRTQDWEQVRLPVHMSFATNVLTLIGGAIYISHGGVPIVSYVIAGAAIFNIVGLGLALSGRR